MSIDTRVGEELRLRLDSVLDLSHRMSEDPELAFDEHRASARIRQLLEERGFAIEAGVADLPTAFIASIGSGDLVLAVCAEMDALPEIGHGCGHNAIAGAGVGAVLALAPFVNDLDITLRLYGTPAEESGTGKEIMVNHGLFDDVSAAIMVHPSLKDVVTPEFRASRSWRVGYTGVGGHASRPWNARNAADATVVAQVGIGLLRQQLEDRIRVHHVVSAPGGAVNVIADRTAVECMIRADTIDQVDEVWTRVQACFEAGAVASGTTMEVQQLPSLYREFDHDHHLAELFRVRAEQIGRTFPNYDDNLFGSTDMGNVSQVVPALHPMLSLALPSGDGTHTAAFAAAAAGPEGDRFVADGALGMALTLVDVAQTTSVRQRLQQEREQRLRSAGRSAHERSPR
ncbi:M20 family metallopeptidase [Nocardioides sp. 1609]|uniref:M20 family metallopeptidase n=1 Tax=Nocardioides sp. 1609 TaxID=2508327 RepID=UPI00106F97C1|nr:M20 family metallopeptidase [Nocardioides sp. 1609]